MRIGINALFRGKPTGVANYIIKLVNHLALLDKFNTYYIFMTPANRSYFEIDQENFHEVICPEYTEMPMVRRLWEQIRFPAMVKAYHIDVLHCPVNVLPMAVGCKTVVTLLDCQYFHSTAQHDFLRKSFNKVFMRMSLRKADIILTISDSMKAEINTHLGNNDKIFVTHLGQDINNNGSSLLNGTAKRLGIEEKFLIFVGFPNHRKNLPRLIKGFARALSSLNGKYDLVICGDIDTKIESDYENIIKAIEETGTGARVKLISYIDNVDLHELLKKAQALIFPTLYEGFGLPVIEAMACGTPVLVSDIPVMREIAGDAGLYMDPYDLEDISDAISRILTDDRLRRDLSVKGAARAAAFTWDETARKTLACYQTLMDGNCR